VTSGSLTSIGLLGKKLLGEKWELRSDSYPPPWPGYVDNRGWKNSDFIDCIANIDLQAADWT